MPRLRLLLLLVVAGCAASRVAPGVGGLLPLWTTWHSVDLVGGGTEGTSEGRVSDACDVSFGTYFASFGVRGLACAANTVEPLGAVVAAAPMPVFVSGPHAPGPDGLGLDLGSRAFGHYDPAFVRWAVATAIPGEGNPALRVATQPVYDQKLRRLARVYWLVRAGLVAEGYPARTPVGPAKDYVRYLRGGPLGAGASEYAPGFSMVAFSDRSAAVPAALSIARDDLDWYSALYEANAATGFWLRRAEDGTEATFQDGLRRLLATYDAGWLAAH